MADFYGIIKSKGGMATRCGNNKDGMTMYLSSWNRGITVVASHDKEKNINTFIVYEHNGSNGLDNRVELCRTVEYLE